MAIGDIGMFLPRESHYGTPGAFNKMLQAEALKRAAFLSNMDQFYENLNEARRQFDETMVFKVETREKELKYQIETRDLDLALRTKEQEDLDRYRMGILDIQQQELIEKRGGAFGDDLTSFEKFKLFGLLEDEARGRSDIREDAAELVGGRREITPGSFWEGPGVKKRGTEPTKESGQVSVGDLIDPSKLNPYDPTSGISASQYPGGLRRGAGPVSGSLGSFTNEDLEKYNDPNYSEFDEPST